MAKINQFKPKLVTNKPKDTEEFLKHFEGNLVIAPIGKTPLQSYINPTDEEWKNIKTVNKSGNNIYFTVNDTDGRGRKKDNITKIRAVFADDDVARDRPRTDFPISPSLIVKTSTTEKGNKYHYYWLTETDDFETWERVQQGIIKVFDTDKSIHDTTRILRVPGFINQKSVPPSECTLEDNGGQVYDWEYILKKFPPLPVEEANKVKGKDSDGNYNEIELISRFQRPEQSGYITDSGNGIIMHMAMHGYSASKIKSRIEQLIESVDPETFKNNHTRYMEFMKQIDKFIKSAKATAVKTRPTNSEVLKFPEKATPLDTDLLVSYQPIPQESLPPIVDEVSTETDRVIGNGKEPAILTIYSIASTLLNKNIAIDEFGDGHYTYCSIGLILAMETGARKTSLYKKIIGPLKDYEELRQHEWEENKHVIAAEEFVAAESLKKVEADIKKVTSKGATDGLKQLATQRATLTATIESLQSNKPTMYIQDSTEEAVVNVMADNQGTISVFSDEGRNLAKNVLGRYNGDNTAEGYVTNGIGGDVIKVNRRGSEPLQIENPCLNFFAMLQPDIAIAFKDHDMYKHSGLAARLPVYFYPVNVVKLMKLSDRNLKINQNIIERYNNIMKGLCVHRPHNPMVVTLTEEVNERLNTFNQEIAHLLETEWEGDTKRTNKIISQTIIYATIIASLDDPEFRTSLQSKPELGIKYELKLKHINMACMHAKALYSGVLMSTTSLDNMDILHSAIVFVEGLIDKYESGHIYEGFVNTSHLQNAFSTITKENRQGVIDILVQHNWLLVTDSEKQGDLNKGYPGGKAKIGDAIYHLNINQVKEQLRLYRQRQAALMDAKAYIKEPK